MKALMLSLFSFGTLLLNAQTLNLFPSTGKIINHEPREESRFNYFLENYEKVDVTQLSARDKILYQQVAEEGKMSYWDVLPGGCSWYCGGGEDTQSASSTLQSNGNFKYAASNAHDLNLQTAWVEGVEDYGIGEFLSYRFPPQNPRITQIIIVNGYAKSADIWQKNSRVKKLKVYKDGEAIAILNLKDTRDEQVFKFNPIGNGNRQDWDALTQLPPWELKFEILEVYPGSKYKDTAITELYFNGIDVH